MSNIHNAKLLIPLVDQTPKHEFRYALFSLFRIMDARHAASSEEFRCSCKTNEEKLQELSYYF